MEYQTVEIAGLKLAIMKADDLHRLMAAASALSEMFAAKEGISNRLTPAASAKIKVGDHPVRAWRKSNGLTQSELAARIGVSTVQISRIENRRREVSIRLARTLSRELGIPVSDLIQE